MTHTPTKRCYRCRTEKPLTAFYRNPRTRDGRNTRCAACDSEYRKERRKLEMYGLSQDDYAALLAAQDGGCAICHAPPTPDRPLRVDHDHGCCPAPPTCGSCTRMLLCHQCNVGLGMFRDDPALLRAAADALERR